MSSCNLEQLPGNNTCIATLQLYEEAPSPVSLELWDVGSPMLISRQGGQDLQVIHGLPPNDRSTQRLTALLLVSIHQEVFPLCICSPSLVPFAFPSQCPTCLSVCELFVCLSLPVCFWLCPSGSGFVHLSVNTYIWYKKMYIQVKQSLR